MNFTVFSFTATLKLVMFVFLHDKQHDALRVASIRALRSLKLLCYPAQLKRVLANKTYRQHLNMLNEHDPIFFLSHRAYLARRLSTAQRINSVINHYEYETEKFNDQYLNKLDDKGLYLWRSSFEGVTFDLRLAHGNDVLYAGASSIVLYQNNERICVISFSIVQAVDLLTAMVIKKCAIGNNDNVLFITRKQPTSDYSYQKVFNKAFDRTTPAHLCMGALVGYGKTLGFQHAIGISAASHPSLSAEHQHALEAAYDHFWVSLNGEKLTSYGYLFNLPLKLTSLDDVDAKARKRAIIRREHAYQVALCAENELKQYIRLID